ncbi:MAG: hypothetical protein AB8B59_08775 [Maribacter sp.]
MMEEELIEIWKSSPNPERVKFEKSRLILEVQSSLDRFYKLIRFAILREKIAGILIIFVFSAYVYFIPFALTKIASFIFALFGVWYVWTLNGLKKHKPTVLSENYLDYLKSYRHYIGILKKMSDQIHWHLIFIILNMSLFIAGPIIDNALDTTRIIIFITVVVGGLTSCYIYAKWFIKKHYVERLKKINRLIKIMEE